MTSPNRFLAVQVLLTLLVLASCKSPQWASVKSREIPVKVIVALPSSIENRAEAERLFEETLRNEIGQQVKVVIGCVEAPWNAASLYVSVSYLDQVPLREAARYGIRTAALAGAMVNAGSGAVNGVIDGVFLYSVDSARERNHQKRLGFKPRHAICKIEFLDSAGSPIIQPTEANPWEIIRAMNPLTGKADGKSIVEEEARALARVVAQKLKL